MVWAIFLIDMLYKSYYSLSPFQSILFLSDQTFAGRKKEVYVLAKILKWLTNSKTKSYQIKYVIDSVLHNKRNIREEEIGVTLLEVIDYFTIRGTFNSVHPDLRAQGVTRVEVGEQGLIFHRDSPNEEFKGAPDEERKEKQRHPTHCEKEILRLAVKLSF